MKLKNVGPESLIVAGGIVHPGAEVEVETDPGIDGLVPVDWAPQEPQQPQEGSPEPEPEDPPAA